MLGAVTFLARPSMQRADAFVLDGIGYVTMKEAVATRTRV